MANNKKKLIITELIKRLQDNITTGHKVILGVGKKYPPDIFPSIYVIPDDVNVTKASQFKYIKTWNIDIGYFNKNKQGEDPNLKGLDYSENLQIAIEQDADNRFDGLLIKMGCTLESVRVEGDIILTLCTYEFKFTDDFLGERKFF
jgi:hypothetical protein